MRRFLLILALFALAVPAFARAADEPAIERTKAFIAAFKKVKEGAPASANQAAFDELDGFLNYDVLTSVPLEPRKDKFTKAQLEDFRGKFRKLIRLSAFQGSGKFFRDAEITFQPVKKNGDETIVVFDSRLPAEDLETQVTLHWKGEGKAMKLVDVGFDGDSLVADYRNQFTRIIDKDGVPALIAKATERLQALEKGKKE